MPQLEDVRKIDLLEDKSDQVKEILGTPPSWLIRWGITIVFIAILVLLTISWIIKYPDVIPSRIVLTTPTPPVGVYARTNGNIYHLFVKENQLVKKDAILAIISNPADEDHILELQEKLDLLQFPMHPDSIAQVQLPKQLSLGEVQQSFSKFSLDFHNYKLFMSLEPLSKEIASLKLQISEYQKLITKQTDQKKTYEKELKLVKKDYERETL